MLVRNGAESRRFMRVPLEIRMGYRYVERAQAFAGMRQASPGSTADPAELNELEE